MLARSRSLVKLKERIPLTLTESQLENVEITWEQWGDPKLPDERTIVILPSFSHSSHAASNRDDPSPGWWEGIIGPGKALNTSIFRVICGSVLGSPFGGTCPTSVHAKSGKRYNADFPQITPADMAYCHGKVLDALNVNKVHAIIGGSMGGMQVIFSIDYFQNLKIRYWSLRRSFPRGWIGLWRFLVLRKRRLVRWLFEECSEGRYLRMQSTR